MTVKRTLAQQRLNEAEQIGFGDVSPQFAETVAASIDAKVEAVFRKYRRSGYPYYRFDATGARKEFAKLERVDFDKLITADGLILTHNAGQALAWSYFPHAIKVRCSNKPTPYEVFHDDEKLRAAIRKRIAQWNSSTGDMGIRKVCRMFRGAQSVSNFRPTAAAAIYRRFDARRVWDMSGGYGGRLLGALVSGCVEHYVATEPARETADGLRRIARDFLDSRYGEVEIIESGSEDFTRAGAFDVCFTSPPYFDTEKYDDDPKQSYLRYPTRDEWLERFLLRTVDNCYESLAPGGALILNIANVRSFPDLTDRLVRAVNGSGKWKEGESMRLALSSLCASGIKTEPVFVWRKP